MRYVMCKNCQGDGYLIRKKWFGLWVTMARCSVCGGVGLCEEEKAK